MASHLSRSVFCKIGQGCLCGWACFWTQAARWPRNSLSKKRPTALFINHIIDPAKDLAFVLGFTDHPTLTQDFTANTQVLAAGLYHLELGGTTAVYDAVDFACQKLMQHSEEGLSRRMLVLLTDGNDNSSHLTPRQFIESATRCNAMVVVLHTEAYPSESSPSYQVLKKLASETGGQIFRAGNKKEVTKAFQQLSEQLRSYYLLAYHPAKFNADGSYRKIELKTTRRGAHIICRRGYYAANK
jgi:Ca-activated chloride channel family protein